MSSNLRSEDKKETLNRVEEQALDESSSSIVPQLSSSERREVKRRAGVSVIVVHEAVREEGERELQRPVASLAFSGLAAGLSMGFSLVAQGLLHAYLPTASWTPLVDNLVIAWDF